jgi:hypothetical protein
MTWWQILGVVLIIFIPMEKEIKALNKRISKLEGDVYDLKNPPKDYYNG